MPNERAIFKVPWVGRYVNDQGDLNRLTMILWSVGGFEHKVHIQPIDANKSCSSLFFECVLFRFVYRAFRAPRCGPYRAPKFVIWCTVALGHPASHTVVTTMLSFIKVRLHLMQTTEHLNGKHTHVYMYVENRSASIIRKWIRWCVPPLTLAHIYGHGPPLTPTTFRRRDLLHIWFVVRRFDASKHLNWNNK